MSRTHSSASSTDNEEHRSVNGLNAKAVFPYNIPVFTERYDVEGSTIYEGQALPGTATSAAMWSIIKYTLGDMTNATGQITGVNAVWDNRTSESYS